MAKRLTTEEQLARLRELRAAPEEGRTVGAIEGLLGNGRVHGIVVKGAAELARAWEARGIAGRLCEVARGLAGGVVGSHGAKRDPGCEGKLAVMQALVEWGAEVPEFYVEAAKWVQWEETWGKSVDKAAECRGNAAIGIARTRPEGAIVMLVDLLADKEVVTRANAAMALGMWPGPEAMPLLRLKARVGDESAEVLGEVLASLLRDEGKEQFTFVAGFLGDKEEKVVEAAGLAMGQSRVAEGFLPLVAAYQKHQGHVIHTTLLMAIGLLRSEESLGWMLELLKSARPVLAASVLDALAIYRGDKRVVERIEAVVGKVGDSRTAGVFGEVFGGK